MSEFEHLDEYKVVREKWIHEDLVISHRMSWLILSQAMLLAAFGWALSNPSAKTEKLVTLLPIFGIIFTIAIGVSIIAAIIAQHGLNVHAKDWPEPYGVDTYTPVNWPGRVAAISLPIFLLIVWLVIGVA